MTVRFESFGVADVHKLTSVVRKTLVSSGALIGVRPLWAGVGFHCVAPLVVIRNL